VRDRLQTFPFHAALKRLLAHRGVPIREDVRGPLRALTVEEGMALAAELPTFAPETPAAAG
jgi:dihydrodipicolinate synthase/N-acetylneuraminate lyase